MMRLRTPLRREGVTTKRWAKHRAYSRELVRRRANGHCEGCGRATTLTWAHLFARAHLLQEPWASSPELTVGLCWRPCHVAYDNYTDLNLRARLQQTALIRFAQRYQLSFPVDDLREPVEAIRRMVETLEEEGATIE